MALSIKLIQDIDKVTDSLYKHSAEAITKFVTTNKINVACHSGCDTCCKTIRIEVLPTEAFYIAEKLKQNYSSEELQKIIVKLQNNNLKALNKTLNEYGNQHIECAFLLNGECSIYNYRPYKCRAFLAKDADFCKKDQCYTNQVEALDYNPVIHKIVMKYINTIKENNLEDKPAELHNAILKALTDDTLLARYLNKEKAIFDTLKF
jgi:Fe-S-cluster containining protein